LAAVPLRPFEAAASSRGVLQAKERRPTDLTPTLRNDALVGAKVPCRGCGDAISAAPARRHPRAGYSSGFLWHPRALCSRALHTGEPFHDHSTSSLPCLRRVSGLLQCSSAILQRICCGKPRLCAWIVGVGDCFVREGSFAQLHRCSQTCRSAFRRCRDVCLNTSVCPFLMPVIDSGVPVTIAGCDSLC
jgi:hypothetical protein